MVGIEILKSVVDLGVDQIHSWRKLHIACDLVQAFVVVSYHNVVQTLARTQTEAAKGSQDSCHGEKAKHGTTEGRSDQDVSHLLILNPAPASQLGRVWDAVCVVYARGRCQVLLSLLAPYVRTSP